MFDYTKAAFRKIADDFKKIDFIRNLLTQCVYIAYLIYTLCIQSGILAVNVILLTLATAYFVFFLYMKKKEVSKQVKQTVKNVYKWCKRLVKLFNLGIVIYGLSITASHFTAVSFILAALMIVGWVLEILFELVFRFFINKVKFILEGMEADYKNITKPVRTVGNFFKKITGKKIEEEPEPTKHRVTLDKMVAQERAKKENERVEKKSKFRLWMQDKLNRFQPKKSPSSNEHFANEQIPAPMEEEMDNVFDEEL